MGELGLKPWEFELLTIPEMHSCLEYLEARADAQSQR